MNMLQCVCARVCVMLPNKSTLSWSCTPFIYTRPGPSLLQRGLPHDGYKQKRKPRGKGHSYRLDKTRHGRSAHAARGLLQVAACRVDESLPFIGDDLTRGVPH